MEERIIELEEEFAEDDVPIDNDNIVSDAVDAALDIETEELNEAVADSYKVEATFYTARCEGCSGITKSGYDVRETIYSESGRRIIAVDPSEIPLGSVVNIKLENGDEFEAEALDIGGAIKGARIDVLVATKDEAYRLGRQTAEIEIISKGDR